MLKITPEGTSGFGADELGYIRGRTLIARFVLPVTRLLRARNAEKYITPAERLLDIGCGDGYFIRRVKCRERYGLDKKSGDEVIDALDFPNEHFDYVTMLAVIEHFADLTGLLREIHRALKPEGRFIFTTPKERAETLIRLYVKDIDEEHHSYFDLERVKKLAGDLFDVEAHHSFLLGLNQAFCLKKK